MAGSVQYLMYSFVILTTARENQRRSNWERLCVLKAWLRIEHRIPDSQLYKNILRSHCYLQGFPCRRLLENPEQVRNLWSPQRTCCSWQWNWARRGRGHTSMALLLFTGSYALLQSLAMRPFPALEEMLLSSFHSKNLFSVTLSPSGTVPINVLVKRKRFFSFPFYCHGTNSPLSYFTNVFTLVK